MIKIIYLLLFVLASPSYAANFSEATGTAVKVFENLRTLAYILSAFGIAAFAVSAIFGRISFKWLGMIVVGLFILANGKELAEYITDKSMGNASNSQAPEAPTTTTPDSTAGSSDFNAGGNFDVADIDPFSPDEPPLLEDPRLTNPSPFGTLTSKYESNGDPSTIAWDSTGGHSYGEHQIAANTGTMGGYINDLKNSSDPADRAFAAELEAAGGEAAAKEGTDEFKAKWKELSQNDDFNQTQKAYLDKTLYEPVAKKADSIPGMDLDNRHPAIKEVLHSTAIQHGPGGASKVLKRALGDDVTGMSDEEIIQRIYAERPKYFTSSTPEIQQSAANRMKREEQDALNLLKS